MMTGSNVGVCFGPTLLWPKDETVAAFLDIKFTSVVVEIFIEEYSSVSQYSVVAFGLETRVCR
jgi:Rho GTPase-activating protein 26